MQKNKNYLKVFVIIFFLFFSTYLYLTVPLHEASYEIQKPFPVVVHPPLGHVEPRDRACICFLSWLSVSQLPLEGHGVMLSLDTFCHSVFIWVLHQLECVPLELVNSYDLYF